MAQYAAFGAILQQFDTADGYVTVAQIDDIQGPGLGTGAQDTTTHDSDGGYRTTVGGVKEIGELTMSLIFDPGAASHVSKLTTLSGGGYGIFKVTFPDAGDTEWAFRAFVTSFELTAAVEGALTAAVTLLGTGKPYIEDDFTFLVTESGTYLVDELGNVLIGI